MAKLFDNKVFQDPVAARKWLEARLWPHGPVCAHCGVVGEAKALSKPPGTYQCNACRKQFTVTVGTVFERSHIPLNKWLMATFLFCASKKGVSAHQMHRLLDVTYKTAWFMMHRLREAVTPVPGAEPPLGGRGKVVEADETYISAPGSKGKPRYQQSKASMKIMSLVERGGKVRSRKIKDATKLTAKEVLKANVHPESILHTDGSQIYREIGATKKHEFVDHSISYVGLGQNGRKVHTNTLEGFFSVFKRGMVGTYQHCGEQHLDRYLAEFDFRQNTRAKLGIDDEARAEIALKGIVGKRLTYRRTNQARHA
jgi:transposase-like protein